MCNVRPEDSGEIKFIARRVESVAYLDVEGIINIVSQSQLNLDLRKCETTFSKIVKILFSINSNAVINHLYQPLSPS